MHSPWAIAGYLKYACQWSCTARPASVGTIPMASRASEPRFACTAYAVNRSVLATCSHWSVPVTRRPLSSQWTTGSATRNWAFTCALAGLTASAISWVATTTVPSPTECP